MLEMFTEDSIALLISSSSFTSSEKTELSFGSFPVHFSLHLLKHLELLWLMCALYKTKHDIWSLGKKSRNILSNTKPGLVVNVHMVQALTINDNFSDFFSQGNKQMTEKSRKNIMPVRLCSCSSSNNLPMEWSVLP